MTKYFVIHEALLQWAFRAILILLTWRLSKTLSKNMVDNSRHLLERNFLTNIFTTKPSRLMDRHFADYITSTQIVRLNPVTKRYKVSNSKGFRKESYLVYAAYIYYKISRRNSIKPLKTISFYYLRFDDITYNYDEKTSHCETN